MFRLAGGETWVDGLALLDTDELLDPDKGELRRRHLRQQVRPTVQQQIWAGVAVGMFVWAAHNRNATRRHLCQQVGRGGCGRREERRVCLLTTHRRQVGCGCRYGLHTVHNRNAARQQARQQARPQSPVGSRKRTV